MDGNFIANNSIGKIIGLAVVHSRFKSSPSDELSKAVSVVNATLEFSHLAAFTEGSAPDFSPDYLIGLRMARIRSY